MKITSKGRYGLKIMLELSAPEARSRLLKSREIAENQNIPLKYLEQIINILKKRGLVISVRGAEGGYRIARDPQEITVFQILTALEGDLSILDKNSDLNEGYRALFWTDIDNRIKEMLDINLLDFLNQSRSIQDSLMYYI
ncbi:MAG: Rrf2 family transcriptional regulator [Leptonema illini]|jgi:Rrf2 family protein|uniref:Transcriptional regulator, BadM/Rrf2 family n=2 Tax=Leptonema illini TaxID=183 RepID=H2CAQ4_9LEPT|nr:Rrf2 family transcriptional regulator [Leptonema illini]EHQ08432.1 transcriptional regulator, BadM/Rrf2 family [Leptonema illini DSM 21528]KAB2931721.1 MAG: Rrf2 family transcriptional regulator [Leptonema illini]PKL34840.1 MAG: Rrf2 family transcriptional regulator [Spirochaetae bacterium HGW-Spirochaetae-10]